MGLNVNHNSTLAIKVNNNNDNQKLYNWGRSLTLLEEATTNDERSFTMMMMILQEMMHWLCLVIHLMLNHVVPDTRVELSWVPIGSRAAFPVATENFLILNKNHGFLYCWSGRQRAFHPFWSSHHWVRFFLALGDFHCPVHLNRLTVLIGSLSGPTHNLPVVAEDLCCQAFRQQSVLPELWQPLMAVWLSTAWQQS